jgi:hypothetical protein
MMILNKISTGILAGSIGGSVLFFALSLPVTGQVNTEKTTRTGEPIEQVTVERGTIVAIQGNNVVVKMDDGTLRDFHNVPDSLTFMVDGKPVNIKNAKVGMKLEKQTITTTTPRIITTVQTVTGKVWQVRAPDWVILTFDDGTNQRFNIPPGQKFTNKLTGKQFDAFGLKKGMMIDAQKVTEVAETLVEDQVKRTGKMPPPPATEVSPDIPILVAVILPVTAAPATPVETASAEPAPKALPKTASGVPLVGMLGAVSFLIGLILMTIRVASARFYRVKRRA